MKRKILGLASEICMWKDPKECGNCTLHEELFCRPKLKYAAYFGLPFLIAIGPVVLGMWFSSFQLIVKIIFYIGWISYAMFFFFIWESRTVCNHCPYYANDSQRSLHCAVDRGKLKTGRYDPGPMSKSEKIQFLIGAFTLFGYPIPFLIIDQLWIPLAFLLGGTTLWFVVIQLKVCTDCVNFTCPLNRVPKPIREQFFNKNPMIKEAWEKRDTN
ncbi:MAG: hypothetical protein JW891_09040 [Candidatus Lokiarchaeota archaeon]|nr:hypothetical protein [Candidatus Lokiarchaeota archaeon]